MNLPLLTGFGLVVAWVVLAFVLVWPSGWAHAPLAAGVVLLVVGIVKTDERRQAAGANRR